MSQSMTYIGAKRLARTLGLKTRDEWRSHWSAHPRPNNVPYNPERSYKGDWEGWNKFLQRQK